ncbi:MAG: NADH-quinone oxidoreductase subunit NuoH [Myxococcales bacterium]|nr:NADH-quinone oxidoreductase subunit NuoH [Myxococcales bacterium]MCB9538513.1 NADH-quinone oxidoreductase subunit NuoH [Myxococcales bacterium]
MNPWLHAVLYSLVLVTVLMTCTAYATWLERKVAGRMQSRLGPTRVGFAGLLQPIADALKLLQKEDIVPLAADRALFNLAPPLTVFFALATAAVIPFSPGLLASDLDIGALYVLALSGLMVFPVWIGSWASNNKYALLGGMRAVAQGISYEIPLLLSVTIVILMADTMSLSGIVQVQADEGWFIARPFGLGLATFALFFVAALAEGNRIPFDTPEAESELVAGPTTEYTGMKFGLFYMAEYLHSIIVAGLGAALFLGGWDGPIAPGLHWMVLKTLGLWMVMLWARWTFLRFRTDQMMTLCWRYLVPASLGLLMAAAVWVHAVHGVS